MESANSHHHHHHHHQLQDQLVTSSSSSSSSCFQAVPTTTHAWTSPPPSFLNTYGGFISYPTPPNLNSRQLQLQQPADDNNNHPPLLSSSSSSSQYSMAPPDFGFYWPHHNTTTDDNYHEFPSTRIKEELAETYYRNYMNILHTTTSSSSPSTTTTTTTQHHHFNLISNNDNTTDHDLRGGTKLLLKSLSSGNLINNKNINHQQLSPHQDHHMYGGGGGRGGLISTHIFPTVNVSSISNQTGFTNPGGSLDMNLEALDLLTSSRFCANFDTSSQNQIGLLRDDGFTSYGFNDHMHQSHQVLPFHGSTKVSSAPTNGVVVETKRSSSSRMEPKAPNAPKKSRLEARASCPPFKVRKEKLGDRIAALQQLVAPFGKTDTASVLMEAIGYIKFLQSQVETLSVPYMKASRNKCNRVMKGGPGDSENEESKRDLNGRGLCLVPLSCLSYITDGDGGAAVWPPPHFGGPT